MYGPLTRSMSSGPMSLSQLGEPQTEKQFASSTLDTNLHKILARKMAGGQVDINPFSQIILFIHHQGVSFRSCKLLTKAYYNLLREPVVTSPTTHSHQPASRGKSKDDPKLNWQTLLQTEGPQVTRKTKPIVLRRPKPFETNHTKWKTLEMTKIVVKTTVF